MSETPEQIIPDEAIDSVWQGANFGPHLTEREVIRNTLLKFACGWAAGKTAHRIVAALGLAAINKQTLTKLGQKYLWACYSNGEFKDSPYQGSAGTWVKASERLPKVGIYNALYNGDHVIFQVHDGGFRVINYHGEKNDSPKLFLIRYLDDSAASPAGDGWVSVEDFIRVRKALEDVVKDYDNCKLNAMRRDRKMYNDNVMIEVARGVLKRVPSPPNKSV